MWKWWFHSSVHPCFLMFEHDNFISSSSLDWVVTFGFVICWLFSICGSAIGNWLEDLNDFLNFYNLSFNSITFNGLAINDFYDHDVIVVTIFSNCSLTNQCYIKSSMTNAKLHMVFSTSILPFPLDIFA